MSFLNRIFGKEHQEPTEEEIIFQDMNNCLNSLDAPENVKYWLRKAAKSAKEGELWDYESMLKNVDSKFVSENYSECAKKLQKIADSRSIPYWLAQAEEKAREGDLDYISTLTIVERRGTDDNSQEKISGVRLIFEQNKWSKVPPRLEELLREAVRKMQSGEPREKVDYVLDTAEKYANVLGYSIRKSEETREPQ